MDSPHGPELRLNKGRIDTLTALLRPFAAQTRVASTSRTAAPRDSWNGLYGISAPSPPQSALMPANLITLPHFSVSSAMNLPKSAAEPMTGVLPKSARRSLIL
jgi:hypothetical protein